MRTGDATFKVLTIITVMKASAETTRPGPGPRLLHTKVLESPCPRRSFPPPPLVFQVFPLLLLPNDTC